MLRNVGEFYLAFGDDCLGAMINKRGYDFT